MVKAGVKLLVVAILLLSLASIANANHACSNPCSADPTAYELTHYACAPSCAPPPDPPASVNAWASPSTIPQGGTASVWWSSSDATSCSTPCGSTSTSGQCPVSPSVTTTYSVSCSGPGGGGSDTAKVTVSTPPPTVSVTSSPSSVISGNPTTISWASTNSDSCAVGFSSSSATSGSEPEWPSINPTVYSVTCFGPGGSNSDSTTVFVSFPTSSATLTASPDSITEGEPTYLTWSTSNMLSCTKSWDGGGAAPLSGNNVEVFLIGSQTLILNCIGVYNNDIGSHFVSVAPAACGDTDDTCCGSPGSGTCNDPADTCDAGFVCRAPTCALHPISNDPILECPIETDLLNPQFAVDFADECAPNPETGYRLVIPRIGGPDAGGHGFTCVQCLTDSDCLDENVLDGDGDTTGISLANRCVNNICQQTSEQICDDGNGAVDINARCFNAHSTPGAGRCDPGSTIQPRGTLYDTNVLDPSDQYTLVGGQASCINTLPYIVDTELIETVSGLPAPMQGGTPTLAEGLDYRFKVTMRDDDGDWYQPTTTLEYGLARSTAPFPVIAVAGPDAIIQKSVNVNAAIGDGRCTCDLGGLACLQITCEDPSPFTADLSWGSVKVYAAGTTFPYS